MVSLSTWVRYAAHKFEYSLTLSWKRTNIGQTNARELGELSNSLWKNFFQGKLTFLHRNKGEEAETPKAEPGGTLLIRKLPYPDTRQLYVGDVVLLKDPEKKDDYLVRRLVATEGYEMISKDEKDAPFVLEENECWVVSANSKLKPKEAKDSRLFGPIPMTSIVGRVIYSLRSAVDHGPVQNSSLATIQDSPVLAVELDVEEMANSSKT